MGRTACTEPQCLYKGGLYLYLQVAMWESLTLPWRNQALRCRHKDFSPPEFSHTKHPHNSLSSCCCLLLIPANVQIPASVSPIPSVSFKTVMVPLFRLRLLSFFKGTFLLNFNKMNLWSWEYRNCNISSASDVWSCTVDLMNWVWEQIT